MYLVQYSECLTFNKNFVSSKLGTNNPHSPPSKDHSNFTNWKRESSDVLVPVAEPSLEHRHSCLSPSHVQAILCIPELKY